MRITRANTAAPLALAVAMMVPSGAHAIPAWARKYNMNCSGCHSPAVPRLNAKGFAFKWAGYRMPEEIGENAEVKQLSDYLAARFRFRYNWRKTEEKRTDVNSFALNDATIFAGGAVGKWFGAFLEYEHAADEVELTNNVYGVWGKEKSFGGVRFGQMHWLLRGAVAGFDRPTGISTPTPLANRLTKGGVPFNFGTDQLGLEAFYVINKNRLSVEVLNGINEEGKGDEGGSPSHKDIVAIDQFIYDANGSGLTAVAYFGSISGLDPTQTETARYTRLAASANKIFNRFELMAGYAWAKDRDLPVGSTFATSEITGQGFWGYVGFTFPNSMTTFGRYEYLDTNKDISNSGNRRYVLGAVLPISLPEYLRMAAEYTLDDPRAKDGLKRHGISVEAMLNF